MSPAPRAYIELLRPANVATALADVLAGFAVAGSAAPWLLASTACLYAGGVVFNDFFDRQLDAVERPERPIPSGRVPASHAAALGSALLAAGILTAYVATREAGLVAIAITLSVLLYDWWGKRQRLFGPVNMGLCRGLNLGLGMAAMPGVIAAHWPLGLLPVVYIAGVTVVSRGEVTGGSRGVALAAYALVAVAIIASFGLSLRGLQGATSAPELISTLAALALTAALCWRVLPAFWRAAATPEPEVIRAAVRTGVLSLVLLDAVIAAAYAGMIYSLAVLLTGLLAGRLARLFAVT